MKHIGELKDSSAQTNRQFTALVLLCMVISFGIRLHLNFQAGLLPGTNGGYYPVMVRGILNTRTLPFNDMPILFYLYAGIIWIISMVTSVPVQSLILPAIQIIDAAIIPLCLLPIAGTLSLLYQNQSKKNLQWLAVLGWSNLSLLSLTLTGDLGKNELAILFVCIALYFMAKYGINRKKLHGFTACIMILFVPLTHFGTFSIVLAGGLLFGLVLLPPKKWIWPLLGGGILVVMILIFDRTRFLRLMNFWVALFEHPDLSSFSIIEYSSLAISFFLASVDIFILVKSGKSLTKVTKSALFSCAVLLVVLSLPIYDFEYFRRFMLMLIVPQAISLAMIGKHLENPISKAISLGFIILSIASSMIVVAFPKQPSITLSDFSELLNMGNSIKKNGSRILIIAPHGVEWWTAWIMKTNVAQDKAFTTALFKEYDEIYYLEPKFAPPAIDRTPESSQAKIHREPSTMHGVPHQLRPVPQALPGKTIPPWTGLAGYRNRSLVATGQRYQLWEILE